MSGITHSPNLQNWIASRSRNLLGQLVDDAAALGVSVSRADDGALIVDCGVESTGSWQAGRRITEISQGGLSAARVGLTEIGRVVLPEIVVDSWLPATSAHGFQVSVPLVEVDPGLRVSGPILAMFENCSESLSIQPDGDTAWGIAVLEAMDLPTEKVRNALARRSGLATRDLAIIVVPTRTVAGTTQIAGRINECVLFTMQESLGIDVGCVEQILGTAPIAPVCQDDTALLPDDFIHYAGRVVVTILGEPGLDIEQLAFDLTFESSPAHGTRFSDLLTEAGGVFEAIPGLIDLNKVSQVTIIDRRSGKSASAGGNSEALLSGWLTRERPVGEDTQ